MRRKSMRNDIKKWIWQHEQYPDFNYDKNAFNDELQSIEYSKGLLDGMISLFDKNSLEDITTNVFLEEITSSFEIEGEILRRDSVRSSLLKRFSGEFDANNDRSNRQSDALVDVLIDCSTNRNPLSVKRLHGWHNVLFQSGYSGYEKINVAKFRINDDMKVVSGAIGQEKTHYQAPPCYLLSNDIKNLLFFCNNSKENIYIKSAIAHLWFVIIHPYDDGNGRIARAITDHLLSNEKFKIYSISKAINQDKKGYYGVLDRTTNLFYNKNFDITQWIKWHLKTLNSALKYAKKDIDSIVKKTRFWDTHRQKVLNQREIKVLTKMLENEEFLGGLSTKKYMAITKTSKATAIRDIKELVTYGCIRQISDTKGRNVRYELLFE